MQYHFEFNIGHARYTIVASRYSQAARHFRAFWIDGYTVTYKGRYSGSIQRKTNHENPDRR